MDSLTGSVWYRERIALPPDSIIKVSLQNVARQDAAAELIASQAIDAQGGPPWPFELRYDKARIEAQGRYVLRASIESASGRLLFSSTQSVPAFDDAPGSRDIMVSRVSAKAPEPAVSLTNSYWKLLEIEGQPAALGADQRELHAVLSDEGRIRGFSGCNRFTGGFERAGEDGLRLSGLASTSMACAEGMALETRFLRLLAGTARFAIDGSRLTLYGSEGAATLRFQAVALP
jgi:putative lipoprotein